MKVATYEGIIENGNVRLPEGIHLPEKTKVYIVVPTIEVQPITHLRSPRLAHPEQAADFKKQVIEESSDAGKGLPRPVSENRSGSWHHRA